MASYDTFGLANHREDAYQMSIQEFQRAYAGQIAATKGELADIIAKAKAEITSVSVEQHRLECVRLAHGDLKIAAEMFAFVTGGDNGK